MGLSALPRAQRHWWGRGHGGDTMECTALTDSASLRYSNLVASHTGTQTLMFVPQHRDGRQLNPA
jgi:hypothetical protein